MEMFGSSDQRELLQILQQLPRCAMLKLIPGEVEQSIFDQLMALGPDEDPLTWLETNRAHDSIRIAVWRELQHFKTTVTGFQNAKHRRYPIDWKSSQYTIVDESTSLKIASVIPSANNGTPSLSALASILNQISSLQIDLQNKLTSDDEASQEGPLFTFLLTAPKDPFDWLRRNRLRLCAQRTLSAILEQALPARETFEIGSISRSITVDEILTVSCGQIVVDDLVFGTNGFSIRMRTRVKGHECADLADHQQLVWRWPGFDQVSDDVGNRYLILNISAQGGSSTSGRSEGKVEQSIFPRVAEDASSLIFQAKPMRVLTTAISMDLERPKRLPHQDFDDLVYRVEINHGTPRNG